MGQEGERTIIVLNAAVDQHLRHGDGSTREVRVIVQALARFQATFSELSRFRSDPFLQRAAHLTDGDSSWRLAVAEQEREDCGSHGVSSGCFLLAQKSNDVQANGPENHTIVLPVVSGLRDQAEIRRVGSPVRVPRRLEKRDCVSTRNHQPQRGSEKVTRLTDSLA